MSSTTVLVSFCNYFSPQSLKHIQKKGTYGQDKRKEIRQQDDIWITHIRIITSPKSKERGLGQIVNFFFRENLNQKPVMCPHSYPTKFSSADPCTLIESHSMKHLMDYLFYFFFSVALGHSRRIKYTWYNIFERNKHTCIHTGTHIEQINSFVKVFVTETQT